MKQYSVGPFHFSFDFEFEFRTKRHDRIEGVVSRYTTHHDKGPIREDALFDYGITNRYTLTPLKSGSELQCVIQRLQARGYGRCLHDEIISQAELWDFFLWINGQKFMEAIRSTSDVMLSSFLDSTHEVETRVVFAEPSDFYFEVYRWRVGFSKK